MGASQQLQRSAGLLGTGHDREACTQTPVVTVRLRLSQARKSWVRMFRGSRLVEALPAVVAVSEAAWSSVPAMVQSSALP